MFYGLSRRPDRPVPASLDTTGMREGATGHRGRGADRRPEDRQGARRGAPGDGLTISFPDLRQYCVLPGEPGPRGALVLLAAILVLIGLLPALYTSRRKVWVRAESNGTGHGAEGRRVRAATQAAVRRGVLEARRRHGAGGGRSSPAVEEKERVSSR